MSKIGKKYRMAVWGMLLSALLFISFPPIPPSYAADIPATDTLRVALFIQGDKYRANTMSVTLSSDQGLVLHSRTSAGEKEWFRTATEQPVRISLDQYAVRWLETGDFSRAKSLYEALSAKEQAYIFRQSLGAAHVYQVVTGFYESEQAARNAQLQGGKEPDVARLLAGAEPVVAGPKHIQAGTYSTWNEAQQQQAALGQAGVAADIAYTRAPEIR